MVQECIQGWGVFRSDNQCENNSEISRKLIWQAHVHQKLQILSSNFKLSDLVFTCLCKSEKAKIIINLLVPRQFQATCSSDPFMKSHAIYNVHIATSLDLYFLRAGLLT